jgi:peptidoglycan/xylan/chitin deacetylase (PgdA/CDA1 family)
MQPGAGEIVWRVSTDKKLVALTFDDGPDPKYTPTVLRLAREHGVKVTFFVIGREVEHHPELARQEVAEGHAIGNHTWGHKPMTGASEKQNLAEIEGCERAIERVCGIHTHLFRPPRGQWDGDSFLSAQALGYRMILWTVTLEHRSSKTPEEMADRVINGISPGMIVLAHDGEPSHALDRRRTMAALPLVIEGLKKRGYRFVTVPELLVEAKEGKGEKAVADRVGLPGGVGARRSRVQRGGAQS